MMRKAYIVVEFSTRELMKDIATKRQSYDDLINELIEFKRKGDKSQ